MPTDSNPFQYTGRENDGDGLFYYRARYYCPAWGRFLSSDPKGFDAGINPYVYAHDNPVNVTDPSGLIPTSDPYAHAWARLFTQFGQALWADTRSFPQRLWENITDPGFLGLPHEIDPYTPYYERHLPDLLNFLLGVILPTPGPDDILMPGGSPIGTPGTDPSIREVPGGTTHAQHVFDQLSAPGTDVTPTGYPGKLVELPGGGRVGFRPASKSGPPTIDVNIPGIPITKIKFK